MLSKVCVRLFRSPVAKNATKLSQPFCTATPKLIPITFKEEKTGKVYEVQAPEGKTLMDVCLDNNVDIEAACGGEMACSTCHLILSEKLFGLLPDLEEEELDMLDLAVGVTDT